MGAQDGSWQVTVYGRNVFNDPNLLYEGDPVRGLPAYLYRYGNYGVSWLFGVKGIGPSRASVLGNLTPVAAIGLSALILHESVGVIELLGIGLILAGVWVVNRQTAEVHG